MKRRYLYRSVLLGVILLCNAFIWYAVFKETRNGMLMVAFLDVGQGDAIFIEAPNGNQVLVDAGESREVLRALGKVMPPYDRTIDVFIGTHPDQDHIGGATAVFDRFEIAHVFDPGIHVDTQAFEHYAQRIKEEGATYRVARRGTEINLGGGAALFILFPDRDMQGADPNHASVILKLVYQDTSFLLTGDTPSQIERYLVSLDGGHLQSTVLKVAHHGSNTSTSGLFLNSVHPTYAVISAGKRNRYGHPHDEVVERLESLTLPIFETSEQGTVVMLSDGKEVVVK